MTAQERLMEALARATDVKAKIDAELEQLNQTIRDFEAALNSRKFGVAGWVTLETGGEPGFTWSRGLSYRKRGKRWCLLIESGPDGEEENWSSDELIHAGRDVRLEAIRNFPDLLEDILENLNTHASSQRDLIARVQHLTVALRAGAPREEGE